MFERSSSREISTTPEVLAAIGSNAVVAIGVSGGKDSAVAAFATNGYLDEMGHLGPRVLIHSDLGRVEWKTSLPECQKMASRLGLELIVVRRESGDLLARWQTRWANNVARYVNLECVKLILPWSTPSMRFCTSELKTAIICRALVKRFAGCQILSVTGIRRQESEGRRKAPISQPQKALASTTRRTTGLDWHSVIEWSKDEVFAYLAEIGFELHEAYRVYGASRVSCAFCIMSAAGDLLAAARCEDNHPIYRELVELEIASTFSFQGNWLADAAPHLLTAETRERVSLAKEAAAIRERAERRIPDHLLYEKGWPKAIPARHEAEMLCEVRRNVAAAVGLTVNYTEPDALIGRYEELMALKGAK